MPAPEWVVENWPGSATILTVRCKGVREGKPTDYTRYYVTSLRTSAQALLFCVGRLRIFELYERPPGRHSPLNLILSCFCRNRLWILIRMPHALLEGQLWLASRKTAGCSTTA